MASKLCLLGICGFIFLTVEGFYMGMFQRNDYMVARDFVFKERQPYQRTMTKYGRVFKCPITYVNVIDRMGIGKGPIVEIVRGGLQQLYVVLRLISPVDTPISVYVYVGCRNANIKKTTQRPTTSRPSSPIVSDANGNTEPTNITTADTANSEPDSFTTIPTTNGPE